MRSTASTPDALATAAPPRSQQHRAFIRFPFDRRGAVAGAIVALLVGASIFMFAGAVWKAESRGVAALLRMSDTPYALKPAPNPAPGVIGGTIAGGDTFSVAAATGRIPAAAAAAGIVVFAALTVVAIRWRRLAPPAKVLWLLFAAIGVATLAYTGFVSGTPPRPVNSLTIGFQRGGLLTVVLATLLFAFEVFPVPGSLRRKVAWLGALCLFSLAWSVVRMALVLATVHHVGSWTFLYLQYLAGPAVDFLSVVAFYSLVTHGLSRRLQERLA